MTPFTFEAGQMEKNFQKLLIHYGLMDSSVSNPQDINLATARVPELIPSFKLKKNREKAIRIVVGKGSYISGLLIYHMSQMAESRGFHRSNSEREMAEEYFTKKVVTDSKNPKKDNHKVARAIFADGSLRIKVKKKKSGLFLLVPDEGGKTKIPKASTCSEPFGCLVFHL